MTHPPARGHYLVKNAALVSVDPHIGTRPRADIEIDEGRIVAVAPDIRATGAEVIDGSGTVAMPGLVETHLHMWSTVGRNFVSEGHEYFDAKHATHESYAPEDYYASARLALADAASAGITTVHNWDHNVLSPEHVDAQLHAHGESRVRARYSYGFRDSSPPDVMVDFADVDRVRAQWFGEGAPLAERVHLGVNVRPAVDRDVFLAEMDHARRRGLPVSIHTGQAERSPIGAAELDHAGLLGPDVLLCHGLAFGPADYDAMARHGVSMSLSPHSEMRLGSAGGFHRQLMHMPAGSLTVALSVDAASLGPVDLFEAMRIAWNLGVPWSGTDTAELPALLYGQVIAMGTINGARALGIADRVGSITPGKEADLILVRQDALNTAPAYDPESAIVRCARPDNVDTVLIGGQPVKQHGELVGVDVPTVVRAAVASSEAVRSRAGGRLLDPVVRHPLAGPSVVTDGPG